MHLDRIQPMVLDRYSRVEGEDRRIGVIGRGIVHWSGHYKLALGIWLVWLDHEVAQAIEEN